MDRNGVYKVYVKELWGYIDTNGKSIWKPEMEIISNTGINSEAVKNKKVNRIIPK